MRRVALFLAAVLIGIQLVPYGHSHTNPPITGQPTWDSPETEQLARRACYGCHSHETTWPWYSYVAPSSWLVQRDVDEGREALNFSTWDQGHGEADEAAETVEEGEMPPWFYLPLHPEADLDAAEKAKLVAGLRKSFPEEEGEGGDAERREEEGR